MTFNLLSDVGPFANICLKKLDVDANMINSPGVFQYTPRVYVYTLNHVILRGRPRASPDGVGWLPRRVRTDGQLSWRGKLV
jgi:hypothetical protein